MKISGLKTGMRTILRPDRGVLAAAEQVQIANIATRLSALAESISQNLDLADAYVALFGALRLSSALASGNSVLVTSTAPGEGKTTIASALPITASLAGHSVLLIDGDLRRSSLAPGVGSAGVVGLTEVLTGEAACEALHSLPVFGRSSRASQVSFMGSGLRSPVLFPGLDWAKARASFRSISQPFDLVLLDSPPVLAANDALLLAGLVDAVVLVVGMGGVELDEVRQAKQLLDAIETPIIGAVLNRFDAKLHGPPTHPYRGYYRGA